ncbi:hypothetical protein KY334_06455 [Candidatus Woesearchaeota archaeon]|nr:hypothetical protein [Candidatus Woesearchaeota archaeon]
MKLASCFYSNIWKVLPPSYFNPKPGDLTLEGIALCEKPSLLEEELTKFAVFTDSRFYMKHLFEKLIPFLPQEFEVIEEPNGQNCFMYCLNIPKQKKEFGRRNFNLKLEERGYEYFDFSKGSIEVGDIIVYSVPGIIDSIRRHAGVYVGNGRVRSRWGINSPLIEHPLKEVISNYWNKDERFLTIERKNRK